MCGQHAARPRPPRSRPREENIADRWGACAHAPHHFERRDTMSLKKFRRVMARLKADRRPEKVDVPGQIRDQLAVIQKMIPDYDNDGPVQKLDAERILGMLADMRKKLPLVDEGSRQSEDARTRLTAGVPVETEEDFEWAAVMDGVESLARDVSAVAAQKRAEVLEMALRVYYAME